MDEQKLRRLFRARPWEPARPGWRCPDEAQLAAFVEGRLAAKDQTKLESHLSDCAACLDQVSFLARRNSSADMPVAPHLLSRARRLVDAETPAWRTPIVRWATMAAAAASIVVAVGLFRLQTPQAPPASLEPGPVAPDPQSVPAAAAPVSPPQAVAAPPDAQPAPRPGRILRSPANAPAQFQFLFPTEGAILSALDPEIRWPAVPGAAYYEAQVVTDEGNVAWSARTGATSVRLPGDGASLQTGKKYFVWIRAYLTGGGTVKSAAVSFHIAGR